MYDTSVNATSPPRDIVVVHPRVVHDGLVVAEDVEAEPLRRAVPVEQRAGKEPRRVPQDVAALPHHLHRFSPALE